MRSRSLLLHDSHLTCSIHHRELADTRAPQQIKSLSIIPAYIVILMAFLAASCGGATTTKPHAEAIGLRWGVTQAQSTVISVPMKDDGTTGYAADVAQSQRQVNATGNPHFPVYYQFEESLLTNWLGHNAVLDVNTFEHKDLPPALDPDYDWQTLIDSQVGPKPTGATWDLPSSYTMFGADYPTAPSSIGILGKWDAANNPSMSADYEITTLSLGWNFYFFYPSSAHHRWMTVKLGTTAAAMNGTLTILLCDPYRVTNEIIEDVASAGEYRKGECINRQEIEVVPLSGIKGTVYTGLIVYEYIGDEFEVSVLEQNMVSVGHDSIFDPGPDYRLHMFVTDTSIIKLAMRF